MLGGPAHHHHLAWLELLLCKILLVMNDHTSVVFLDYMASSLIPTQYMSYRVQNNDSEGHLFKDAFERANLFKSQNTC